MAVLRLQKSGIAIVEGGINEITKKKRFELAVFAILSIDLQ